MMSWDYVNLQPLLDSRLCKLLDGSNIKHSDKSVCILVSLQNRVYVVKGAFKNHFPSVKCIKGGRETAIFLLLS